MRYGIDADGWLYEREAPPPGVPHLIRSPLPQAATQAFVKPWSVIDHTQAGSGKTFWRNLFGWWQRPASGGVEAHLIVEMDGGVIQFMPFIRRADCNFKANGFYVKDVGYCGALSVETQDEGWGPGKPNGSQDWPPPQFESLAQVWASASVKYDIPIQDVAEPFGRGISYHSRHDEWSKYVGKSCPGAARIAQMEPLRSRIYAIVNSIPTPNPVPEPDPESKMTTFHLVHRMIEQKGKPDFTGFTYVPGVSIAHQQSGLIPAIDNRGNDIILVDLNNFADEFNRQWGTNFSMDSVLHAIIESVSTTTPAPLCVHRNGGMWSSWANHAANPSAKTKR